MRRATLLALALTAGVALAQNPFRDLAPTPEPQEAPAQSTPITIDIPASQLPSPPLNVDGFPALPANGTLGNTASGSTPAAAAPVINVPDQPVVFDLPTLSGIGQPTDRHITLRNPLHDFARQNATPLLKPLPTPQAAQPTEEPETTGEEQGAWCVDAAVLATSGGRAPTALIRCDGATHLLRVGDLIPGTDATIETIDTLGVTITLAGQGQELQLASQ